MSYNPKDLKQNWLPVYLRAIADKFGLRDWVFEIERESPEDHIIAAVMRVYGRKFARLRFGDSFWNVDRQEQRDTVVHELIHCHYALGDRWVEEKMKSSAYGAWTMMNESAVDALAAAVAPSMPLPPNLTKANKAMVKAWKAVSERSVD